MYLSTVTVEGFRASATDAFSCAGGFPLSTSLFDLQMTAQPILLRTNDTSRIWKGFGGDSHDDSQQRRR